LHFTDNNVELVSYKLCYNKGKLYLDVVGLSITASV